MVEKPVSLIGVSAGFQVLRYNTDSFEKWFQVVKLNFYNF